MKKNNSINLFFYALHLSGSGIALLLILLVLRSLTANKPLYNKASFDTEKIAVNIPITKNNAASIILTKGKYILMPGER